MGGSPSIFASDFSSIFVKIARPNRLRGGRSVGESVSESVFMGGSLADSSVLTLNSPSPFSGVKFAPRPGLGQLSGGKWPFG